MSTNDANEALALASLSQLGKQVWMMLDDNEFSPGEIVKVQMSKEEADDGSGSSIAVKHYIAFDNGERQWLNLEEKEESGQLVWELPPSSTTRIKQESSSDNDNDSQGEPTRKREANDNDDDDSEEGGANQKRARVSVAVKSEAGEEDDSDEDDSREQQNMNTKDMSKIDNKTKTWIKALGLENAYGTGQDGLDSIVDEKYVAPHAFEQIFLLADYLFPEKDYHKRLWTTPSRPGISVRQALRKRKKANPNDPVVSWHKPRGQWLPPTAPALVGMVAGVIVDM